jgi:AcrR family transcriptional regulator
MGINKPSLYATFGDKAQLFRRALDRYVSRQSPLWEQALRESSARAAVERFLNAAADSLTSEHNPHCCLLVGAALSCGEETEGIKKELAARRADGNSLLRARLLRARADGELAPGVDVAALARYFSSVLGGMSVEASGGATRQDLQNVIDLALKVWPA